MLININKYIFIFTLFISLPQYFALNIYPPYYSKENKIINTELNSKKVTNTENYTLHKEIKSDKKLYKNVTKRNSDNGSSGKPLRNMRNVGESIIQDNIGNDLQATFKFTLEKKRSPNFGILLLIQINDESIKYVVPKKMVNSKYTDAICDNLGFGRGLLMPPPIKVIDFTDYMYINAENCVIEDVNQTNTNSSISKSKSPIVHLVCKEDEDEDGNNDTKSEYPSFLYCPTKPFFFNHQALLSIRHASKDHVVCTPTIDVAVVCATLQFTNSGFLYEYEDDKLIVDDKLTGKDKLTDPLTEKLYFVNLQCKKSSRKDAMVTMLDEKCGFKVIEKKCDEETNNEITCPLESRVITTRLRSADVFYNPNTFHETSLTLKAEFKNKKLLRISYKNYEDSSCKVVSFNFNNDCFLYHEERNEYFVVSYLFCLSFEVTFYDTCLEQVLEEEEVFTLTYHTANNQPIKPHSLVVNRKEVQYKISSSFIFKPQQKTSKKNKVQNSNRKTPQILPRLSDLNYSITWTLHKYPDAEAEKMFHVVSILFLYFY